MQKISSEQALPTVEKPLKILICGNYGAVNIGDEAILEGILMLLRNVAPHAEITVMSADPEHTTFHHKVESVAHFPAGPRSLWKGLRNKTLGKTWQKMRETDLFILGGGGLFNDDRMLAIVIWSLQAHVALFLGKPLICLGQSIGPLKTFFGRHMTKSVYSRARLATVRDSRSAQILQELNLPAPFVLADPAFCLHTQETSRNSEKYVVLSFRPSKRVKPEVLSQHCARFIDWLWQKYGLKSILIPFQITWDNDSLMLNRISEQVSHQEAVEVMSFSDDYKKVMDIIGNAYAVVGMRLHSLIFSVLSEKPFLALSYSNKVEQFIQDIEMEEFLLPVENVTFALLCERFQHLVNHYEKTNTTLTEHCFLLRKKAHDHEEVVKHFLIGSKLLR